MKTIALPTHYSEAMALLYTCKREVAHYKGGCRDILHTLQNDTSSLQQQADLNEALKTFQAYIAEYEGFIAQINALLPTLPRDD